MTEPTTASTPAPRPVPAYVATIVGLLAACVLGTLAWLVAISLLILGTIVVSAMEWQVPGGSWILAFVVGMPIGAWIELKVVH